MICRRIVRISRVVSGLARATAFYRFALGFSVVRRQPVGRAARAALGLPRATQAVLRRGGQEIALVCPLRRGRRIPPDSRSNDLWFQHLAIVVADMDAAFARLSAHTGWQPISQGGPQALPASSGGVQAFKFRDPDGHPLELIRFPRQQRGMRHPGIDHTALAVASARRSAMFYRALGLRVRARSLNHGPAQSRLDGLADARVQVTALRPFPVRRPGIELLAYHPPGRRAGRGPADDLATDWVTLAVTPSPARAPRALRDPDGHRLLLVGSGRLVLG